MTSKSEAQIQNDVADYLTHLARAAARVPGNTSISLEVNTEGVRIKLRSIALNTQFVSARHLDWNTLRHSESHPEQEVQAALRYHEEEVREKKDAYKRITGR